MQQMEADVIAKETQLKELNESIEQKTNELNAI
jgi:hypothetical protein